MLLRRSEVNARLTREEKAIRTLESKVAALEAWRPDLEKRIEDRTNEVNQKFDDTHAKIDKNMKFLEQHIYYVKKDWEKK